MVSKTDRDDWRPICNYWRLNVKITIDHYPLPHIHDLTTTLKDTNVFSKIDLVQEHNPIPVTVNDISETVVISLFGPY